MFDDETRTFLDDYTNDECYSMVNGERTGNWSMEWAEGKVIMHEWDIVAHNEPTWISSFTGPDQQNRLQVLPNPASDFVQVQGDITFPAVLRIYNMTGRLVREEGIESGDQQVNVSGLQQGLFIIRMSGKNSKRTATFIRKQSLLICLFLYPVFKES